MLLDGGYELKVLVTGAAGFLGSHVADRLSMLGHEVVGIDNLIGGDASNVSTRVQFHEIDCCDRVAVLDLSRGCDAVYHCAALAYEGLSVFSPALVGRSIFDASTCVFSAAIANNVKRIVFCSSMARYGTNQVPFREEYAPRPQDPYGIAKVAAEQMLINLCDVHGTEYVIAVPHNIIGPRQKYDDPFRNVASIMINLMLQGRQPVIYGDGAQKRCFSFVHDCVDPLVAMLNSQAVSGHVINIGPDDEYITINELFSTLSDLIGYSGTPVYMPGRPQEVREATCSADKARALLRYRPEVDLRSGLQSMIQHIRQRGPRPFNYHLNLEIINGLTPLAWRNRIF